MQKKHTENLNIHLLNKTGGGRFFKLIKVIYLKITCSYIFSGEKLDTSSLRLGKDILSHYSF